MREYTKSYKIKAGTFALLKNNEISLQSFLLKELYQKNDFSLNLATNFENIGITLGYTPNILMRTFETHLGLFNSYEDLFSLNFSPKIGIGVTLRL